MKMHGPKNKILSMVDFKTWFASFSQNKSALKCGALCVSTDFHKLPKKVTN